jgi:DNA-binding MarR family transcriptional regulator
MSNSYIHFLSIVEGLGRSNPAASLDDIERQLLVFILLTHNKGQLMLVGDLIQLSRMGSQATLHGRIKNLEALGYINLAVAEDDARKKFVTPTKLAEKYLVFMSDCLARAVKNGK